MGFAICRFNEETGCSNTGSQEYHIVLEDLDVRINVPSMWKHYAIDHLVRPNQIERDTVMNADPRYATGNLVGTRSVDQKKEVKIMYVEKMDEGYSHSIGSEPDYEFVGKLENLLSNSGPLQTKEF